MTNAQDLARTIGAALRRHSSGVLYGLPGGGNNLEIIGAAEAEGVRFIPVSYTHLTLPTIYSV